VYAEAGAGKTLAQAGLCLKFSTTAPTPSTKTDSIAEAKKEAKNYDTAEKKSFLLSGGGGFPDFYSATLLYGNYSNTGSGFTVIKDYGAVFVKGEMYDPRKKISYGATLFYTRQYFIFQQQGHYTNKADTFDYQDIGLGIRVNSYLVHRAHFHSYIGVGFGAKIPLHDYFSPVYGELVFGLRFMPTERLGIYVELGPSKVLAQAGVSIKL
jgi:hypothetical protein